MSTFVTPLPQAGAAESPTQAVQRARALWSRVTSAVWRALQESGRNRARRQLLDLADACHFSQPDLARELRAAAAFNPLD